MLKVVRTAVLAVGMGTGAVAAAATPLSPAEIKATFGTGVPFAAASATGSARYSFVLKPDATATRTSKGGTHETTVSGTWRVDEKGYCTKWGSKAMENCYTVEKNGKRYDVKDSAGKIISHWTL
jgi:hypothetical protein